VNVFREKLEQPSDHLRSDGYERNSDELLQGLPVAVYTTDATGHITFYNEAAAELWGYTQNSARVNSAAHGKCIGLTARPCLITNARWRLR
jgi:PAS domain-containing protein